MENLLLGDGQCKRKSAATSGLALDPNLTALEFHKTFGNGEAETGSFGYAGRRAVEYIKDLVLVIRRNPTAGILHRDGHPFRFCDLGLHDHLALSRKFECVVNKVPQHLLQFDAIRAHRHIDNMMGLKIDGLLLGDRFQIFNDISDDMANGHHIEF